MEHWQQFLAVVFAICHQIVASLPMGLMMLLPPASRLRTGGFYSLEVDAIIDSTNVLTG